MNIKPFRLTAGAYLLSKDTRGRGEREKGGRRRRDLNKKQLLFEIHSHMQRQFPFSIMASICFPLLGPHEKIIINILLITLQMCHFQDCFGKKKEIGNEWPTCEKAEFINHCGFIGFRSKTCLGLAAI